MNQLQENLVDQDNPNAKLSILAQSMETDGRTDEQKALIEASLLKEFKGSQDPKISPLASRSPVTSTRGKGNGRKADRSSPLKIPAAGDSRSRSSTAGNVVITSNDNKSKSHVTGTGSSMRESKLSPTNNDNLTSEQPRSQNSKVKKPISTKQNTIVVAGTSDGGSTNHHKKPKIILTDAQKVKIQEESKTIIWKQNQSLFVVGKTRDRVFHNNFITLNSVDYQPQKSCYLYSKIKDRVVMIEKMKRKKVTRLAAKINPSLIVPTTTNQSQKNTFSSIQDFSTTSAAPVKTSKHSSFRKPKVKAIKDSKGSKATVKDVKELKDQQSHLKITDLIQSSEQSIPTENPLLNESSIATSAHKATTSKYLRQQTHEITQLKEITEMTQITQENETSLQTDDKDQKQLDLVQEEGPGDNQDEEGFAEQDQLIDDEKQAEIDNQMIVKLLQGQNVDQGRFAEIRVDYQDANDAVNLQVFDFDPQQLVQKKKGMSYPQKKSVKQAILKAENDRNERLNDKMKSVIGIAKKQLCKSPQGAMKFHKIVEDLNLKDIASSSDESEWDVTKEMKKFRAGADHQKVADQRLREKLVRMGKIKKVEDLKHVDSLVESAYNSAKALEWGKYTDDIGKPRPSWQSEEEYDLFSQSDESQESKESVDIVEQVKKEGRMTMKSKNNPLDEMKMAMLGFEPGFAIAGSSELINSVQRKIAELNGLGTFVPEATTKIIYKKLCDEFQTAPIDVFKKMDKEQTVLKFDNYGLSKAQAKPLSLIIPFMKTIESIVMKNCGLKDEAAADIITSSLGSISRVNHLDFTGVQLGKECIKAFTNVLKRDPCCIKELIMANLKTIVPIGDLFHTLQMAKELQYLDLSGNYINFFSIEQLSNFIKSTVSLEYLSLKECGLRGKLAERVIDSLMLNSSIKYLDLSNNKLCSANYIISGKLGRLVQGHPNLLHVDLSFIQISREELIFLILCVRDSKNIQGFHLTGNQCSAYDRLLMRALLPCKVKYPLPPSYAPRFERITSHDKVTLVMLNLCFMTAIPPNYIPEIGLGQVSNVEEVRERIKSHEKMRQLQEQIELKKDKEYQKTEVHYKELIEYRLETLKQEKGKSGMMTGRSDTTPNRTQLNDQSVSQLNDRVQEQESRKYGDFKTYNDDPDRIYDMFSMIDFYSRKKTCLKLGHPLTNNDDKLYKDQRHRINLRIKELKASKFDQVDNYTQKMRDLKQQLAEINSLLGPEPKETKLDERKGSQKTIQTDNSSIMDELVISPIINEGDMNTDDPELTERILDQKLKNITKENQETKQRAKAIQTRLDDQNVISKVKQLITLPNDHVAEMGAFANPMRGHKDKIIFTRLTGHPNTIDNNIWFDTSECWVCAQHSKLSISVGMSERLIDQEFDQIIMLTAMMTKRSQKRQNHQQEHAQNNLEALLEEKSAKSFNSDLDSQTSGSGADIEGEGDPAYLNQTRRERKINLFRGNVKLTGYHGMKEKFESDQDDGEEVEDDLQKMQEKDAAMRQRQVVAKDDQSKAFSFAKFNEPRNLIPLTKKLNQTISLTSDPASNLTLFNSALTARPIQLKNVLQTVYQEYNGAQGPDRFNQPNHKYHALNGVLYRNLHNQQDVTDKINKSKNSSLNATDRIQRKKSDIHSGQQSKRDSNLSTVDLTQESYLFKSDKMMTKFEIQDSALAKEIEKLKEKELYHTSRTTSYTLDNTQKNNQSIQEKLLSNLPSELQNCSNMEETDPHAMWLVKRGLAPNGQIPPIRIKTSGREFYTGEISLPKTAQNIQRPRRNISLPNRSMQHHMAGKRQAFTSHATARASSFAGVRQQRRQAIYPGTVGPEFSNLLQKQQMQLNNNKQKIFTQDQDSDIEINSFDKINKDSEKSLSQVKSKSPSNRTSHIAYNPKIKPKQEEEDNYNQFWAIFNQKEEQDAIYFVSSINNWMPIKLVDPKAEPKSQRKSPMTNLTNQSRRQSSMNMTMSMSARNSQILVKNQTENSTPDNMLKNMNVLSQTQGLGLGGFSSAVNKDLVDAKIKPQSKLTQRFLLQDPQNASGMFNHAQFGADHITESQDRLQQINERKESETLQRFVIKVPYKCPQKKMTIDQANAPLQAAKSQTDKCTPAYCVMPYKVENGRHHSIEKCKGHQADEIPRNCQITWSSKEGWQDKLKVMKANQQMQMKSQRKIIQDVQDVEMDDIDNIKMETNLFCRPGKHFFFFIRKGKHFMLSSKYGIERYKQTNVQMNFVCVKIRGWKIGKPMVDRDEEWKTLCEETANGVEMFDKSKSVFRNFRLDTDVALRKMFENDLRLTKIPAKIKDKDQFEKVKEALFDHYAYIKNLFLHLTCDSTYPAVNKQDFDIWSLRCGLHERPNVDEAKINLQREGSLVKNELTRKITDGTAKNDMLRFQFLEVCFRLAELCYQGDIKTDAAKDDKARTPGKKKKGNGKIYLFQAINKLFKEHIYPEYPVSDICQDNFRDDFLYTFRVNQYYERNESVFKRIHAEYNYAGKHCLSPNDGVTFVTLTGGIAHVKERFCMRLYGYSKQSCLDYHKTPSFPKELQYVEFLEFFGRLAFWTFEFDESGNYRHFELHEKIDALLAHYCKKLNLSRVFSMIPEAQNTCVEEIIDYNKEAAKIAVFKPEESQQSESQENESSYANDRDASRGSLYHSSTRGSQKGGLSKGQARRSNVVPHDKGQITVGSETLKLPLDRLPQVSVLKTLALLKGDQ